MRRKLMVIWLFPVLVWAQKTPAFLSPETPAYSLVMHIHRFQYRQAQNLLKHYQTEKKDAAYSFMKVNYFWWMMVTNPREISFRDSLRLALNETEEKLKNTRDPHAYYIRLLNSGYKFRLAFKEERFLDALVYSRKMTGQINYALEHTEESPFLKLTAAIYLFSTGYGKRKYWFLYPYFLMIPKGNEKLGLQYLKELTRDSNELVSTEARYVLMRIYLDIYGDYKKALTLIRELTGTFPENLFFKALEIKILNKAGLPYAAEEKKYNELYRQTRFVSPAQARFFSDWRHIR